MLDTLEVQGILGREIRSTADENMGRIVDVLVDGQGMARAAIIDFGGFLGVGSRKIAVAWQALHFVPQAEKRYGIVLELTRDQREARSPNTRKAIVASASSSPAVVARRWRSCPSSLPHPSRKSLKRLDWFVFLVADVQTGFGPFVAVYLTSEKWTQIEIGLVLTVAGPVSLLGQIPGGALVDAVRSERVVAAVAVTLIATSALVYATFPIFPAGGWSQRHCTRPRAASWDRPSRRSASASSAMPRSANASAATHASRRSARHWRRR